MSRFEFPFFIDLSEPLAGSSLLVSLVSSSLIEM